LYGLCWPFLLIPKDMQRNSFDNFS
jgi:hypothetical protein